MRKIFVFMFLYVDKWNYHVGFFLSEPTYVVHIFTISVQSRKTKKKHCINAKWFSAHVSLKMTICLAGCDATAALYTNTNATPPDRNTLVLTQHPTVLIRIRQITLSESNSTCACVCVGYAAMMIVHILQQQYQIHVIYIAFIYAHTTTISIRHRTTPHHYYQTTSLGERVESYKIGESLYWRTEKRILFRKLSLLE